MKKEVVLKITAISFFAALCLFCVTHTDKAAAAVRFVASAFFPVTIGLVMAFIVNIPMSALERLYVRIRTRVRKNGKSAKNKDMSEREKGLLRIVSLNVSLLLIAAVVAFVMFLVIPELAGSLKGMMESLSQLPDKLAEKRGEIEKFSPMAAYYIFERDNSDIAEKIANWAVAGSGTAVGMALGLIKSALMGIYYFVAALIIMMSVLKEKERIAAQIKKFLAAHIDTGKLDRLFDELKRISDVFSSFISGQCLEACILGLMFFVSMTLLRFPYALVVSSLITVTALIPIFGAFIGLAVGAVLIVTVSPVKAIWFIVLFFVLQQLEGNLIYPRVVGGSVGLPPLWTLLAVIIGGDMMGVLGMIVFIPLFSVVYSALSRLANRKGEAAADDK